MPKVGIDKNAIDTLETTLDGGQVEFPHTQEGIVQTEEHVNETGLPMVNASIRKVQTHLHGEKIKKGKV